MEIINRNPKELLKADYNPRKISDKDFKQLKKSLETFQCVEPIIVNQYEGRENVIVGGHQRLKAMLDLGWSEVPTIEVHLDIEEEKELNVRLNKNTGEFDFELLTDLFELDKLEEIGFDPDELPDITEDLTEPLTDPDEAPEPPKDPKTRLGDIYELGSHRLMCGDSTSIDAVEKLMEGEKAELVFTDPPYRYAKMGDASKAFGKGANNFKERIKDIIDFDPTDFLNLLPLVFDGNMNAYIFCNTDLVPDYLNFALDNGYSFNILTWHKNQHVPFTGTHHYADTEYLIYISKRATFNTGLDVSYAKYFVLDNEKHKDHPTIKPQEIIKTEIQISSSYGGNVLDLFGGSGSTMLSCEQLGRRARLMELDPKYCDVIVERWENFTGRKAKLLENEG